MIPDWETNIAYFCEILPNRHPAIWEELSAVLQRHGVTFHLLSDIKDIWACDFMPVQIAGGPHTAVRFVKFLYEPSYLANHPHLVAPESVCDQVSHLGAIERSRIKLDGGNVVASTHKVIVTDKVFQENSSWPQNRLLAELHDTLEVDEIIIIPTELSSSQLTPRTKSAMPMELSGS